MSITGYYPYCSQWCLICLIEHGRFFQMAYALDAAMTYILLLLTYSLDCGSKEGPRTALNVSKKGPERVYKVAKQHLRKFPKGPETGPKITLEGAKISQCPRKVKRFQNRPRKIDVNNVLWPRSCRH